MNKFASLLVISVATAALCLHSAAAVGRKEFRSAEFHFVVQYPSSWHTLYDGDTRLDIINFPDRERQKGIVISPTGAEITVGGPPPDVRTVNGWIQAALQDDAPIEETDVSIPSPPTNGCSTFRRVVWRTDSNGLGERYFRNTAYYCSKADRLYSVFLTNWEGDPKQTQLEATALKIAESLRMW